MYHESYEEYIRSILGYPNYGNAMFENSYQYMPDNFRNTAYIDDLNNNKVTLSYKDPVAEIKAMLPDSSFISVLDTASQENPDLLILLSN